MHTRFSISPDPFVYNSFNDSKGHTPSRYSDTIRPQCSAHGLRKAQCRRFAEVDCTAPQIAAISGHKSPKEIQLYMEEAEQARLARTATAKLIAAEGPAEQGGNDRLANLSDAIG
jgi:hypothetical protein